MLRSLKKYCPEWLKPHLRFIQKVIMWPWRMMQKPALWLTAPYPVGLWIINVIVQRIFRINGDMPFMVHYTSRVSGRIKIGKGVDFSMATSGGCYIQGINGVEIGENTIFAWGVKIVSANHALDKVIYAGIDEHAHCPGIKIGKHVWLGANAVILPGVNIGDHAVIGCNSVVTHAVPARAIVAGAPAKILRYRETLKDSFAEGLEKR